MKIIVCGAGKIGQNLAKYLSHSDNDIVLIDTTAGILKEMSTALDIQTINGNCAYPEILEQAGAENADIIIAMTGHDEVNMITCQIANSAFKIPTKIARISSSSFLNPKYINKISWNNKLINKIISPEIEVANSVFRSISAEWANEVVMLAEGKMRFVAMECEENSVFVNASIRQISRILPDINMRVVMIMRDEQPIFPSTDDKIIVGDEIYFSIPAVDLQDALGKMNISLDLNRNIIIVGGGKVGVHLVRMLEASKIFENVTLVEKEEQKAIALAEVAEKTTITCGDILDDRIQEEIGLENADMVISLMGEELNIISSLVAKNKGVKTTIATIENDTYDNINDALGIDILIDSNSIIVSSILRYVRKGQISAGYSLKGDVGEILESQIFEGAYIVNQSVKAVKEEDVHVIYIQRDGEFLIINDDTEIQIGDNVALFALETSIQKAEKILCSDL